MQTLKQLFKVGPGPSASHTIGPYKISKMFKDKNPSANSFIVKLYGALSATGKGHMTDFIIEKAFAEKPVEIIFSDQEFKEHPNAMELFAIANNKQIDYIKAYSIGGGEIIIDGQKTREYPECYPQLNFTEVRNYILQEGITIPDYVKRFDEKDVFIYLNNILDRMFFVVESGLNAEGIIPGGLELERIAKNLYSHAQTLEKEEKEKILFSSFAYAAAEVNAAGGVDIVTAPTCGASGVLPASLYYFYKEKHLPKEKLVDALAVAGVIGNVIKKNGSISGAMAGCQAEIGTACAMSAAAIAYLFDLDIRQIEYAAELALEHHLGLTCDPVKGLVQIPCIERNAVAAIRALDAAIMAKHISIYRNNRISFDDVVEVMLESGKAMIKELKETSKGGLATKFKDKQAK